MLHELAVPLTDEEEARLLDRVEQLRAEGSYQQPSPSRYPSGT